MENEIRKPTVVLTGTDGNVFSIIGKVARALERAGQAEQAKEFKRKCMFEAGSYDAVLDLCCDYVEVE